MMVSLYTMATLSEDSDYNNCSVSHISGAAALLNKAKKMKNDAWCRTISNASTTSDDSFNDSESECGSILLSSQDDESDEDALDRIFAFDEELADLDRKPEGGEPSSIMFEEIFFVEQ